MSSPAALEASVIVPTFNDWTNLSRCLACLEQQDLDPTRFEVVIGNNNADDMVPDNLQLAANVRVVWAPEPGSYAARNAAVNASRGDALFFTDADCRPATDWLSTGLHLLSTQTAENRFGGEIRLLPAGQHWEVAEHYDRLFNLRQARYVERGYAATANLLVTRSLFERVGPFDDSLYSSGDKQWNRRAGKLGSIIRYAPELVVEHYARNSFEEHAKKRARVAKGRFMMKNPVRQRSVLSRLRYLLPSLPAALVIFRADGLSISERLALLRFDYRMRRVEYTTLRALAAGTAGEHR